MINKSIKLVDLSKEIQKVPTRNGYGEGLLIAGERNHNVVVLCADLTESTRSLGFKNKFPERFIEMGVAEQNLATVASGMAAVGKIPFISSYAVFSPGRNWEQIRTTICYNDQNVKIAGAHAGISVGPDGATHQMLEDIAITRALPNMKVIVPCDSIETKKATLAAAEVYGPVYLRFAREKTAVVTTEQTPFNIGKAEIFREGNDVAIIACGPMVYEALIAAEALERQGISVMVVNNHTIKPLDKPTILNVAKKTRAIITAEEHQTTGGLGSAIAEFLSQVFPVPMRFVGVKDRFGESGNTDELMKKFGLTAQDIIIAAKEVLLIKEKPKIDEEISEIHSTDAKKLLGQISPDYFFRLRSGGVIKNISELKKAAKRMDKETFSHHVNQHKNDFSNWIKEVFKDQKLANLIKNCKTREDLYNTLTNVFKNTLRK